MFEKAKHRPNQGSRAVSLNQEQAVYEANLCRWLSDHEGDYVLIKGERTLIETGADWTGLRSTQMPWP